ncbi:hypothetical protein ACO1KE_04920 [Leptospira interrogans serovar Bataviae]|uniref:hypothetical protein n=1 Tax=Leptospira interrogans TaxID=173 RepID=UPI003CE8CC6C
MKTKFRIKEIMLAILIFCNMNCNTSDELAYDKSIFPQHKKYLNIEDYFYLLPYKILEENKIEKTDLKQIFNREFVKICKPGEWRRSDISIYLGYLSLAGCPDDYEFSIGIWRNNQASDIIGITIVQKDSSKWKMNYSRFLQFKERKWKDITTKVFPSKVAISFANRKVGEDARNYTCQLPQLTFRIEYSWITHGAQVLDERGSGTILDWVYEDDIFSKYLLNLN